LETEDTSTAQTQATTGKTNSRKKDSPEEHALNIATSIAQEKNDKTGTDKAKKAMKVAHEVIFFSKNRRTA
jgi:hypothetical protein